MPSGKPTQHTGEWRPAPVDTKVRTERLAADGEWKTVEFTSLRKGDIVRFFDVEGDALHPLMRDYEPDGQHATAVCVTDAFKNPGIDQGPWAGEPVGYIVELDLMETESAN